MKRFIIVFLCYTVSATVPTQGALTEGLFILQNKIITIKERIQQLKKELTECFIHPTQKSEIEEYHCLLKQMLYPPYIDELNTLVACLEADCDHIKASDNLSHDEFDADMKRAFLMTEKIDLERKLLFSLQCVDTNEYDENIYKELFAQSPKDKKIAQALNDLQVQITKDKDTCSSLKRRLAEVDAQLFVGDLTQDMFLGTLSYYTS